MVFYRKINLHQTESAPPFVFYNAMLDYITNNEIKNKNKILTIFGINW